MIGVAFTIDDSHFNAVLDNIMGAIPPAILAGVTEEARIVNQKIRDQAPHGTGVLEAVIGEYDPNYLEGDAQANPSDAVFWVGEISAGEMGAIVGTNLEYARHVNDGYTVGPNQYAKFTEDGERVLRRLAPGTWVEGVFFFEKGTEDAKPDYQSIMMGRISNAILNAAKTVRVTTHGKIRTYTAAGGQRRIRVKSRS